jgi:CDGSH-type Zn-finger protein
MSDSNGDSPKVSVTEDGPYMVEGGARIQNASGEDVSKDGKAFLCRCGHSSNKPFCDGTHSKIGFDGSESADHGPIAARQDSYTAERVTILDDRSVCSHAGECTDRLPSVWKLGEEPWIDPDGASAEEIKSVIPRCPSGALEYVEPDSQEPDEESLAPRIEAAVDGPLVLRGGIPVTSVDGRAYEVRNRQTLCRCGKSSNKPFCDGSHWDGFKDPAEPESRPET